MDTNISSRLKPQQVRRLGITVGLALLVLVWLSYFFAYRSVNDSFTKSTERTLTSETTLLEDHLERSFNLVTTMLMTMGEMTSITMVTPEILTTQELQRAIGNSHVIRSLSLLDSNGLVLTSSNPSNIGKVIKTASSGNTKEQTSWQIDAVRFGQVLPYRDLQDWAWEKPSPTQKLMPAFYSFIRNGQSFTWIATINISFFENVWSRIDHNPAVEIAVFNYNGKKIMSHHGQPTPPDAVFNQLFQAISTNAIGNFYLNEDQEFLVVYRSDTQSPMIVASIANMEVLKEETAQTREFLLLIAMLGSALIIAVMLALYRLYIRQARASVFSNNLLSGITAHVMMTQSNLNGIIEDVNEPMLATTGYQKHELIGQSQEIFNNDAQRPELFKDVWSTLGRGDIWRGTFRYQTKSGNPLWLTSTIIPFRDEWDQITHYVSLYSNVTQAIQLSQEYERERAARMTLESLNQKLRTDATLDPLTGLANRRGLDEFVQQMHQQSDLAQMSLAVLMIDIDHFKRINDTWGHAVGDDVLRKLAVTWSELIRSSDLLVRLGGEEFALILPRTPRANAEQVAEKLRIQTAKTQIGVANTDTSIEVTISIGVTYSAHVVDQTIDALLHQADQALYTAKSSGRNRVVTQTAK